LPVIPLIKRIIPRLTTKLKLDTISLNQLMKIFFLVTFFFLSHFLYAQTDQSNYKYYAGLTGGLSKHGTGDMLGVSENIIVGKYFRKKLSWSVGLGGSLHDGVYPITSTQTDGTILDHSYRYVTGGFQASGGVGYSFIRRKRSEFGVRASGILRYQSSSYYDRLFVVNNQTVTELPYPATYIFNSTPQRTYSIGIAPDFFYNHAITKSLFIGLSAGFQADTNSDVITHLSLSIGKRFN